jgi:hypothetical protein
MAFTQTIVGFALSLFFYLSPGTGVPVPEADLSERQVFLNWEASVAERMESMPNPYQDYAAELPGSLDEIEAMRVASGTGSAAARRYFEMEDSGDWMGFKLSDLLRAGLQVEFTGYAEDSKTSRRMTNQKWDPYHPAYLLTTAGLQMRF